MAAIESRLDKAIKENVDKGHAPAVGAIVLDRSGKTLYKRAYGTTNLDDPKAAPFTSSTSVMIWSCTKFVASVAALQLLEKGQINLDDPVEKYIPEVENFQVLTGFKEDGSPTFRDQDPTKKPTLLHLFTHTSGMGYDLFDHDMLKWRTHTGKTPAVYVGDGSWWCFQQPLLFDAGEKWNYGVNIDWLGAVVQAVTKMNLAEYVQKNILDPLEMKNTGSHVRKDQDRLIVHLRGEDGKLTAAPEVMTAESPELYGGGHYLHSTLDDYAQFLVTMLNNGTHPTTGAKILEKQTVKNHVFKDMMPKHTPREHVGHINNPIPPLSHAGEFLPGVSKGFSCGLMTNKEDAPNGRKAGSGAWAGLGNLYYWIDPAAGKTALIVSEILPFMDKDMLHLFDELERAVYEKDAAGEPGEKGSNFVIHA